MGYSPAQVAELRETLDAVDADLVLAATPIDLTRVLTLNKPIVRVRYELAPVGRPVFLGLLAPILERVREARAGARPVRSPS
jgi:predicted GTPase